MQKIQRMFRADPEGSKTQKTMSLSMASMFSTIVSLVLSVLMARMLTKTQLAAYKQTLLAIQTVTPFLGLGLAQGFYYVYLRNEGRQRAVFLECAVMLLGTGTLYGLFILLGGNNLLASRFSNPDIARYLLWMVPYVCVCMVCTITSHLLVANRRIMLNAKFSVISNLLVVLVTLLAVLAFRSAGAALIGHSYTMVVLQLTMIVCIFLFVIPSDQIGLRRSSMIDMLKISLPLGFAGMIGTLDKDLDKWIVSFLLQPEEYAVFSIGAQELPLIGAITSAVSTVITVDMVAAARDGNNGKALELFRSAAEKTSMLLLPLMLFFMVIAEPFIQFLYTTEYTAAIPIFRVYLLYLPIRVVVYGPLLIALGQSKAILWRSIMELVLNAVVSIILVRWLGAMGATIATIVVIYLFIPYTLFIISRATKVKWYTILPFRHFGRCLVLCIPAVIACVATDMFTRHTPYLIRLIADTVAFVLPYGWCFVRYFHIEWKRYIEKALAKIGKGK